MASETVQVHNGEANDPEGPTDTRNPTKETRDVDETSEDGSGERPVRQKLKKTSIAEVPATELPADSSQVSENRGLESLQASSSASQTSSGEGRGRVRKRSLEDVGPEDAGESRDGDDIGHRRKRSRDSKDETRTPPPGEKKTDEEFRSPKKKRSRDQFDADNSKSADTADQPQVGAAEGERETKRHRDNSQERIKDKKSDLESTKSSLPAPFSNTSAASPFASLPPSKASEGASKAEPQKDKPATSSSAFASSSLAAFAGSETSPFGTIGSGKSVFKSASATPSATVSDATKEGGAEPSAFAKSAFGAAAANPSPFSSIGGGFGGSVFGSASALKPGGGLSSFASPSGTSVFGSSSKTKPFGSASDDEEQEGEGEGEEGDKAFEGSEEQKEDPRFVKQETETGEEGEETYFSCRAKLYQFVDKEWKERGVGTLKINVAVPVDKTEEPKDGGESGKPSTKKAARFLMRSDGVLRVILNTPLYKGMKVGTASGEEPTGKLVNIAGVEDGKIVPLLIRTGNLEVAKELYHTVQDLLPQL
ncbi:hypothetical protein VTO42DRAFT_1203 [Malbranchea cinnamomea]